MTEPAIGMILLGGALSGALVRDVRLANELADRGYRVCAWWVMDRTKGAGLRPQIEERWLFNGLRFWPRGGGQGVGGAGLGGALDAIGRGLNACFKDTQRAHGLQKRPRVQQRVMENLMRRVCDGVEHERGVVDRFARELRETGVTHVLPMLEMLCPWVEAASQHVQHPVRYCVTFQGYELYSMYARSIGRERDLYDRLIETVARSDWPAIAVSEDYRQRVAEDVGVPLERMVAIPPGVPAAQKMEATRAHELIRTKFHEFTPGLPLITYLGRRDVEKGIDLLLYAARILIQRERKFQLAICGPSLWGDFYGKVCRQIAEELRCPVMWRRFVPDDVRTALFTASRCVVYPSIHREPFGMVAAEAIAHGTPALVPDYGGVASAIESKVLGCQGVEVSSPRNLGTSIPRHLDSPTAYCPLPTASTEAAGLRFKVWDSGDLADQLDRLLQDDDLHRRLSEAGPRVAEYFSIANLADRVLAHIGLPPRPRSS